MVTAERTGLFAVLHASGVLESRVEAKLADVGLSNAKLAALHRLTEAGGSLPLGQLAERLACVKSNITQLVDRLEADGLVQRMPAPQDRRSKCAAITPEGRRRFALGLKAKLEVEQVLLQSLSPAESEQLAAALTKLSADAAP